MSKKEGLKVSEIEREVQFYIQQSRKESDLESLLCFMDKYCFNWKYFQTFFPYQCLVVTCLHRDNTHITINGRKCQ